MNTIDFSPTAPVNVEHPNGIVGEIEDFLNRFICFPDPAQLRAVSLWILHTHAFEAAYSTPYMYVHSVEPQCGKTRVIDTVKMLVRQPENAAQTTVSALFRVIESRRPTIFLDEVDAVWSGASNEELRGMLNSGYKQGGYILRTVPGGVIDEDGNVNDTKAFNTFCPKLLAGIDNGQLPNTIADRCIPIALKRKRKDQEVERLNPRKVEPQAEELRSRIAHWVALNIDTILDIEPDEITDISDRAFEISEPLLAIAQVANVSARNELTALLKAKGGPITPGGEILRAAKGYFNDEGADLDYILTSRLETLVNMPGKRIGHLLDPYGVESRTINPSKSRRLPAKAKGYYRRDFEDAWERYL